MWPSSPPSAMHAVLVVVDVVVAAVVGVGPGDDAAVVVVDEAQGQAGGVGDRGEVAVGVAVAHELLVGAVLGRAGQGQGGDAAVVGGELQVVAAAVHDAQRGAAPRRTRR